MALAGANVSDVSLQLISECPATAFRLGRVHLSGQVDGEWCGGRVSAESSVPVPADQEHCEGAYVDPLWEPPEPAEYAFDCSQGCAKCVYGENENGIYVCTNDRDSITTGCNGSTSPGLEYTQHRTRLTGSLDESWCWSAINGLTGTEAELNATCTQFYVDPADPDTPASYAGGCTRGCSACYLGTRANGDYVCKSTPAQYTVAQAWPLGLTPSAQALSAARHRFLLANMTTQNTYCLQLGLRQNRG